MLIYHFGTRDGLLREILGQARQRQVEAFTDLIRLRPDEPYPVTLARAWSAISGPQGEPYLRMFSRLHDTAGEPLWPGFRRTATTDWLAPLEDGMRSLGRPELATVVLAVIRGLLMDLDATGDAVRTDRAFPTSSPRSRAPDNPKGCGAGGSFPGSTTSRVSGSG